MNKNIDLIVSLATYSKRIATVPICLESLFNQSLKPRKIILNIDDSVCIETLSPDILKYTKKGLEIVPVSSELRSHNKYFYTFLNTRIVTLSPLMMTLYIPRTLSII